MMMPNDENNRNNRDRDDDAERGFRPIGNPLPLIQWLISLGVVSVMGWLIFEAINGLGG